MEQCSVQILVVVAIIQVRILKAEVENGFVESELRYKWLDPKSRRNRLQVEFLYVLEREKG